MNTLTQHNAIDMVLVLTTTPPEEEKKLFNNWILLIAIQMLAHPSKWHEEIIEKFHFPRFGYCALATKYEKKAIKL